MPEEESYITLEEAKEMLDNAAEERELSLTQKFAQEHASKFARLNMDDAKKLQAELADLKFIPENIQIKIVDFLPEYPEEIRVLFSKERMVLEKSHIDQILSTVRKYK